MDRTTMMRPLQAIAALVLAFGCVASLAAKPYLPDSDAAVLERLPEKTDPTLAELKRLRQALATRPADTTLAARLARRAIEASRATGDPRFLGQAQAALAPWWTAADAPLELIVLRATIRQSLHDFDAALRDLDAVLLRAPGHGQARITRATVLTVVGRYAEAEQDCAVLSGRASALVVASCAAGPMSLDGRAQEAYGRLVAARQAGGRDPAGVIAWAETLAAEIAARRSEPVAAEAHFRAALQADPEDAYLRGAFADFLLDRGRPREAAALVGTELRNDALLLRLALAESQYADPTDAERRALALHRDELAARFAASRARGDVVHRREEARFALHLQGDGPRALALARANWAVQRESADLRILAEAARATGDAPSLAMVEAWRATHRLEDAAVLAVLEARP